MRYTDPDGRADKNTTLDWIQGGLDAAGCIPGIGEIADCANGIISLCRGDFLNAGLSFISMVPVVGDAVGKGGKAAGFIAKNGDKIAVGVTSSYNAIKKGPLPEALAKTFRSGSYSEVILESDTVLYRVYGGNSGKFGQFWTRTKPFGPLQSQIDLALKPEWGNTAENIVSIKVPKGTTIFEGVAESQGYGLVGGGNQIIIPKVDQNWELP